MTEAAYDYIVAGAGSAGCVVAARLSEDPDVRVLLVEAGGTDGAILVQMPAAVGHAILSPRFNWRLRSEPEPRLNNRGINTPRGRGLGGSSSINGMIYIRGHARDYDRWAFDEGCPGWSYGDVLPYFRRAEDHAAGADAWHGIGGPLHVRGGTRHHHNPLYDAFIAAGVAAGYPTTADVNGAEQEGFGRWEMTVNGGRRWSTANAYLHPAGRRDNLTVVTSGHVSRIVIENGRAVGLAMIRGGTEEVCHAEREVIVCAGAIASPQILMLSGIGPAGELGRHGNAVRHDVAGVGANLHDHLEVHVQQACRQPITLYRELRPHRMLMTGSLGSRPARAWARPITMRRAPSSRAGRMCPIPTSRSTSCPSPTPVSQTGALRSTAIGPTSVRLGHAHAAGYGSPRTIRLPRPASASTISPTRGMPRTCAPVSRLSARSSLRHPSIRSAAAR